MSRYRRANTPGATYFFTVVTYRRRGFLCDADVRVALREAITRVRSQHPFFIDAWVLLPDHLHTIWTLPPDDARCLALATNQTVCGATLRRASASSGMDDRFQNQTPGIDSVATTLLGTPNP